MTEKTTPPASRLCPTCGTRLNLDASRCLVCGTELGESAGSKNTPQRIQGARMPEITLSLPVVLLMFVLFLAAGAGFTYLGLSATGQVTEPTPVPTGTTTPTATLSPTPETPTATYTPNPTGTPISYVVQTGDTCGSIAFAFNVSIQSIILQNSLSADCGIFPNTELKIPQPTATPTPLATATLSDPEATIAACPTRLHIVQEGETLSQIAIAYGFSSVDAIMEWNGKTVDTAFLDERLVIPLCELEFVPGIGTVTPSPAPPYPAPELLLPRNGDAFSLSNETVALQWSAVGELRNNEYYQITITDLTSGNNVSLTAVVQDTKFNVPASLRPSESKPHIFEWFVTTVAQVGVAEDGSPVYASGGATSNTQTFSWSGGSSSN